MIQNLSLWLRWSWRDLRERWAQVGAVALIIALGTGVYAGLGSTTPWRYQATDKAYERLNTYDLRLRFIPGSYVDAEKLVQTVSGIEHADWIETVEPRLLLAQHIDASTTSQEILIPGRVIGMNLSASGPHVNRLHVDEGRTLDEGDSGQNIAILEHQFASTYDLPSEGDVRLSGGQTMHYVGVGMTPDYLFVMTEDGLLMAQEQYAVLFTSLETAQQLAGMPGMTNDLVLTLADGAKIDTVKAEIESKLAESFPGMTIKVTGREDDPAIKMNYTMIDMTQAVYSVILVLFWAGAALGASNLTSRIVESQRRQIGIGIALGMPTRMLIFRPLLVGAQIAFLGALAGIGVAVLFAHYGGIWIRGIMPLPTYGTILQTNYLLNGAVIGFGLSFIACLYPVWRAVRVPPIDAIRTGHLVKASSGWAFLALKLPLPGKSFGHMPVRNLLRAPRRTILTILGVATAVTTLVGLVGCLDSVRLTINTAADEMYQQHPDRLVVAFNRPYPLESNEVQRIEQSPALSMAEPGLGARGKLIYGSKSFNVLFEGISLGNPLWSPTILRGEIPNGNGVLISRKAAKDLDADIGDTIILEHPQRKGLLSYQTVQTKLVVTGIHAHLWRTAVYMDIKTAGELMGIEGMTSELYIVPADGLTEMDAKRELFGQEQIGTVMSIRDVVHSTDTTLREVIRFLSAVEIAVIALAFLIAFNSTTINLNEREREIATMFAFGLPLRTVVRMAMIENFMLGLLGTVIGIGSGMLFLVWYFGYQMPQVMPEVMFPITVSPFTLGLAILIGVSVMTLTPLITIRRMARMDIPAALRVME